MRPGRYIFIAVLAAALLLSGPSFAQQDDSRLNGLEYQVKTAFLYNFTGFISWPSYAFAQEDSPLKICVLGEDPFGPVLDSLEHETRHKHPLKLARFDSIDQAIDCHVLFLCNSERTRLKEHLTCLQGRPVLTVSDMGGFAAQGGMIEFLLQNKRVRFSINLKAANHAGLHISSKLLNLASKIEGVSQEQKK